MWVPNMPLTIISAVTASAGALCIFKDMYGGPAFDRDVRADNLTVVVTGANAGIGKETVTEFAKRGAKVFMACRDMDKCEEVRRDIVLLTNNKYVYCRPCNLASLASVREFARRFKAEEPYLNILVNNAAVMEPPVKITNDGFEAQLGINHLGHFLLTNLLLDNITAASPARIITLTCSSYKRGHIHRKDLNMTENYVAADAYAQSKLANVLFTRELARRLIETKVSVSVVDPGLTDTDLSRHLPAMKSMSRWVVYPMFWPVMKRPRIAAQAIMHAALAEETAKSTGDYFVDMKKAKVSKEAEDFELAIWLWQVSERWTRLRENQDELKKPAAA